MEFEASYVDVGQQVLVTRLGRILWMIEEATLLMGKLLTVLSFFKASSMLCLYKAFHVDRRSFVPNFTEKWYSETRNS